MLAVSESPYAMICFDLKKKEFDYRSLCRQEVWVVAIISICNQVAEAAASDQCLAAAASFSVRSKIRNFLFKKFTHFFNNIFLHLPHPFP